MPGATVTRHDEAAAAGQFAPQACGHAHTVAVRHLEVEDGDVGALGAGHREGLGARGGLRDDFEVVLQGEEGSEGTPDEVLVVF
ncbi:predicted protein [Streptomyces sp. SPB78]|nr:predicted protein [Streptomyces sp. SPB78]